MPPRTSIMTAIPYVNSTPHIGNILTTLSGDVTARYRRLLGEDVFFVAGTDENGLKIKEAAEAAGRDPDEFVADIAQRFKQIFEDMEIRPDDFVRTTEERHVRTAQTFFRTLQERGHIYKGKYEGWYDVSTETFFKETDLVDGKSPDGNPVRWIEEESYFFRMSAFEQPLLAHIEENPGFIVPESRRNEVLSFIRQGLRDVCISRQNPGWGIAVPGDESQVIYVWFDALINYITATGWPEAGWEQTWPPVVQWLGKDILTRFHATLWPAMLMGVGLPLPEVVAAHAWIVLGGGEKLSKSKGNVVTPIELAKGLAERAGSSQQLAVDAVRHYLCATMPFENDFVFTYDDFDRRYNSDLANDIGNALNRSLSMAHRYAGGVIPDAPVEPEALEAVRSAKLQYEAAMQGFRLDRASEAAFALIRWLGKYTDTRAPWTLAKAGDPALDGVIRSMLLCVRAAEGLTRPEMPTAADAIAAQLGVPPTSLWSEIGQESSLAPGTKLGQPKPIFPRLDLKKEQSQTQPAQASAPKPEPTKKAKFEPPAEISIEQFMSVQLKIGRILEAEAVEGSEKLVKLQVVIGEERRQVLAGIRKSYELADLIGMQVVVVTNLKPATLMGQQSQGMILAADAPGGGAILLTPESEAPEGASVH